MIDSIPGVSEAHKQQLMRVLDVDPNWRMHQVSDGQRRRVQICVGLLRPFKVGAAQLSHDTTADWLVRWLVPALLA